MVVRDKEGNTFAMPFAYMAALDENAAKQIYAVARNAVNDALRDFHAGISALLVQALTPRGDGSAPTDDNPNRLCAANLATGMCNKRRGEHPIEGHEYSPGALFADDEGVPQLDIDAPPSEDEAKPETEADLGE